MNPQGNVWAQGRGLERDDLQGASNPNHAVILLVREGQHPEPAACRMSAAASQQSA